MFSPPETMSVFWIIHRNKLPAVLEEGSTDKYELLTPWPDDYHTETLQLDFHCREQKSINIHCVQAGISKPGQIKDRERLHGKKSLAVRGEKLETQRLHLLNGGNFRVWLWLDGCYSKFDQMSLEWERTARKSPSPPVSSVFNGQSSALCSASSPCCPPKSAVAIKFNPSATAFPSKHYSCTCFLSVMGDERWDWVGMRFKMVNPGWLQYLNWTLLLFLRPGPVSNADKYRLGATAEQ